MCARRSNANEAARVCFMQLVSGFLRHRGRNIYEPGRPEVCGCVWTNRERSTSLISKVKQHGGSTGDVEVTSLVLERWQWL